MPEGQRIKVQFLVFDLQSSIECYKDYLKVDSKYVHCGNIDKNWTIVSFGNSMTLNFVSDAEDTRAGFLAVWSPTTDNPPAYLTTDCGTCKIFRGNLFFTQFDRQFEMCTTIDGDKKSWCEPQRYVPMDAGDGTHDLALEYRKEYCQDPRCPGISADTTPQASPHPDNEAGNTCCKYYNRLRFLRFYHILGLSLWCSKQKKCSRENSWR